jgi:hypothetical protein
MHYTCLCTCITYAYGSTAVAMAGGARRRWPKGRVLPQCRRDCAGCLQPRLTHRASFVQVSSHSSSAPRPPCYLFVFGLKSIALCLLDFTPLHFHRFTLDLERQSERKKALAAVWCVPLSARHSASLPKMWKTRPRWIDRPNCPRAAISRPLAEPLARKHWPWPRPESAIWDGMFKFSFK